MIRLTRQLLLVTILLLLAACQTQPTPTATGGAVAASPQSTARPTMTSSPSPIPPSASATPPALTATPLATATMTPVPTASPEPAPAALPLGDEFAFEFVAQEGGEVHSVAVAGDRVFVGAGLRVLVLDVANPAAPQVIARSEPLPGPVEALLAVQEGAAVQLYAGAGQRLVTLAAGAAGELAAQGTLPLPGWVSSLALGDGGLFVGGALPGATYPEGGFVALVDVQQPGALSLEQTVETANYVSALAFARCALYSAHLGYTGARLMVTAVEGGQMAAPQIVRGVESELYTLHMAGDTLLAGGYGTLQAFDIANPQGPQRLWEVEQGERFPLGMVNGVAHAGGQLYLSGWQPAGAYIPFRHSLRPPEPLAGASGAPASNDVLTHGARLYVAEHGELEIYDISQPATLNALGRYKPFPSPISDLTLHAATPGDELLMLYAGSSFDRAPEELLSLRLPSLEVAGRLSFEVADMETMIGQASVAELAMGDGLAYAVARDGIYTVDLADAAAPQVAGRYPFPQPRRDPRGVALLGERLYLGTGWGDSVEIAALTPDSAGVLTQTQSVSVGRFQGSQLMAITGAGERLYVTAAAGIEQGWLHVVHVGDEMEVAATLPLPGYAQPVLAVDGELAATAVHSEQMGDVLLLVDLSAPAAPAIVARVALSGLVDGQPRVHALTFKDGLLFVILNGQRLLVVDVTEPARPRGVGLAPLPATQYSPHVSFVVGDGVMAAASEATGVMLFSFEAPAAPETAAPETAETGDGVAATARPAYCPDDAPSAAPNHPIRVYFAEAGDLRIWDEATDSIETLAEGGVYQLFLSPDGGTVAFLRQEEPGMIVSSKQMTLWAIDANGANERQLIGGDQFRAMAPQRIEGYDVLAANPINLAWLPGTGELVFRVDPLVHAIGVSQVPEIRAVHASTGAQRVLLTTTPGSSYTFSPDGRVMTLADDTGLDLLALDNGRYSRTLAEDIVTYPTIGLESSAYHPGPIWAQDGSAFSIPIPSANPFMGEARLAVWEVTLEGPASRELGAFDGFPMPVMGNTGSAIFSPDRTQVAFYHTPERHPQGDVLVAAVDGAWQVAYDSGANPRFLGWAPDGGHFAYAVGTGAVQRRLRIGRLCEPPLIFDGPPPAGDTPVVWIDGQRFLYQSERPGRITLLLGALDGSVHEIGQVSAASNGFAYR